MDIDSVSRSARRFPSSWLRGGALALPALALALPVLAASTLEVKVVDDDGRPLVGVTVVLAGTGREAVSDAYGLLHFESLPPGAYDLTARLAGFGSRRVEVALSDDAPASVTVTLSEGLHFSESVTVSPNGRDTFESYQPTAVIGGVDLLEKVRGNLGETLQSELGVNVRAFGPGPSRPVVRGLDGDRVLVLENGARTGDLSSQSADHGVTLDPVNAEQIDVVRGPATLLYGSSAVGGVVNVIDNRIPDALPEESVAGTVELRGGSVADERGGAASLQGGSGRFAWSASLH
ncbi:MAG TPA: TonB-dependent receptor plug domain-containing protein, partial [Vicinamibacteria bacterium]